jgi:hypothetical protein
MVTILMDNHLARVQFAIETNRNTFKISLADLVRHSEMRVKGPFIETVLRD